MLSKILKFVVDVEQGRMKIDDQSAAVILEQWFSENF